MLNAIKEYNETVLFPAMKWLRKHWKGYMVFVVAIYGITFGAVYIWLYYERIVKFLEEIKRKLMPKKEEEES